MLIKEKKIKNVKMNEYSYSIRINLLIRRICTLYKRSLIICNNKTSIRLYILSLSLIPTDIKMEKNEIPLKIKITRK